MGNNFGDLLRHAAAKLCGPAKRVYRLHFLKRSSQDSHTLDTPHNRANTPVRAPTVVFDPVTPVNLDVPLVFFLHIGRSKPMLSRAFTRIRSSPGGGFRAVVVQTASVGSPRFSIVTRMRWCVCGATP